MDVNGTRFQLVLTQSEWLAGGSSGEGAIDWDNGAVRLRTLLPVFPPRPAGAGLSIAQRRGAARDRYGNWYWISDDTHEIRVRAPGYTASAHFWSAADTVRPPKPAQPGAFTACAPAPGPAALSLQGLAVTTDHYLVVGVLEPAGLLVFDLYAGGGPLTLEWPSAIPFAPFDISASDDGGLWILDRASITLWRLDRSFQVVGPPAPPDAVATFIGCGNAIAPGPCAVAAITTEYALPLPGVISPVAVEALNDGTVVVLDDPPVSDTSIVFRRNADGTLSGIPLDGSLDPGEEADEGAQHPLPMVGYDLAFAGGALFIASAAGNQTFAFTCTLGSSMTLVLQRTLYPMRDFGGKALVAAGGQVFYDFDDRWVPLVAQPAPRFDRSSTVRLPAASNPDAVWFDGREPRCVWHRVLFDGCVPSGTSVLIEARASDDPSLLASIPWQMQPTAYQRGDGAEIPYYQTDSVGGTYELLFQNIVGRYLQLRVTLSGTGRASPRVGSLRIYYPRFSYLRRYLPACYQDDAGSASFLDRYLADTEGMNTVLEGRIEQVQMLFDVRTTPASDLDWLAGWFGATLDSAWSEPTRRLFLKHAMQAFRERGTCAGIVRTVRLALDACADDAVFADTPCSLGGATGFGVRVVERYRSRNSIGVLAGDPTAPLTPTVAPIGASWTPDQGGALVHAAYRAWLAARYLTIDQLNAVWGATFTGFDDPTILFPAITPTATAPATDWQQFSSAFFAFSYPVVIDADQGLYRDFLIRRYRRVTDAQSASWSVLSTTLPPDGTVLADWIEFVSTVLPVARAAHWFTVLVPVALTDSADTQQQKLAVTQRVVDAIKPAHTGCDVRLYWGMFRVGEARLGLDTVLGPSDRAVALVLDRVALGSGYLGFVEPWTVRDRVVVGRAPMAPVACC